MGKISLQWGTSQTSVADYDTSRALLVVGVGVLAYEAVSKATHKTASETMSKKWAAPLVISMAFMIQASKVKLPKLQAEFISLCIIYVGISIWAMDPLKAASLPGYMVDMVEQAKRGAYRSKIGYEEVLKEVEVLMNKNTKPNALLLANPGVGKSTIPETIAHKIATAQYPSRSPFFEAKLIQVDFTDLMASTMYRGTLEQRIQEMTQLAKKDPKIIYFIDEIHKLAGGGTTIESRVDVSEMLLPVMARGEIRILSATTLHDYTKYIQPRQAFARRLPLVTMYEPTPARCFEMLQHSYSQRQGRIKVSNDAIKAAIVFSKDVPARYFPDKAIDLIDNAISHAELELDDTENYVILTEFHIAGAKSVSGQQKGGDLLVSFYQFLEQNPDYFAELNDEVD